MSRETLEWLNENTLIGFTDKRGHAWHYRAGSDNHYTGAVPVADVERRLFNWTAEESPLYVGRQIGNRELSHVEIPGRKAIVRSDTGHVMGIFTDGYRPHQYGEWLIDNVSKILDDGLSIGSAGLLKGGAVAWVSVEVPDTITTPEGVAFRPNLLATTSFNGSVATTYKPVVTNVVCDNTMQAGLSEDGRVFKVRHSSKSLGRTTAAREALGIVFDVGEAFERQVKELCAVDFTDRQFESLIEQFAPYPEKYDPAVTTQAKGVAAATACADAKRDEYRHLWTGDDRVSPWRGTAFGAWQALNTYSHHVGRTNGDTIRQERNMLRAVDGTTAKADSEALSAIMALTA